MGPTSMTLLVLLAVVAAAVPLTVAVLWWLRRGEQARRWMPLALALLVVLGQAAAVGAVGINANREYGFFLTWDEAFGGGTEAVGPAPTPQVPGFDDAAASSNGTGTTGATTSNPTSTGPTRQTLLEAPVTPGDTGKSSHVTYKGPRSGLTGNIYVWTPPQYDDPQYKDHVFPVVLAFSGIGADDWYYWGENGLQPAKYLQEAVVSGKVAPFVVVMPSSRFPGHPDPECLDAPGGAQSETWAMVDVPDWVRSNYRVSERARDWTSYGFSLGGYCGLKMQIKHPDRLGSAIMFSGNLRASANDADPAVRKAIAADPAASEELLPLLKKADPHQVRILIGETQDPQDGSEDLRKAQQFKTDADAAGHTGVQVWDMGQIGHHPRQWGRNAAKFLEWATTLMRS